MPTITLDYAPYTYQEDLHFSEARYNVVVGGRRVGKSKMALQELIKHCLSQSNAMAWWVAPTIAMARDVGFLEFKEFYAETLAPVITNMHESHMRVRFRNGSYLYFKGGDSEKALRGAGLTYCVVDEAAFVDEEVWTRALLPALADKQGKALLISTPNGRNWFHRLATYAFESGKTGTEWKYYHWPSYMNPLMTPATMEALAASSDQNTFRQEFLAEFITAAGMVYDEFGQENLVEVPQGYRLSPNAHEYEIYLGIDFGFANPTAIAFMALELKTGNVTMFEEIYIAKTPIDKIQDLIIDRLNYHHIRLEDVRRVYTDPAGNAAELSSGISPVDSLRMGRFHFNVENKGSEIAPGLALVRSYIRAADGTRRFKITTNCAHAIRSLMGYTYAKSNTETIKEEAMKDGIHDHMADAIRYFFVNRFDHARYVAESPEVTKYTGTREIKKIFLKQCDVCRKPFTSHTPQGKPPHVCKGCS